MPVSPASDKDLCITTHEFLNELPVDSQTQYLILGTIYPWSPTGIDSFSCAFFYGNQYSFWNILKQAFPRLPIDAKNDILCPEKSVEKIKSLLQKYHIAVSDTVKTAVRPADRPSADIFLQGTQYNEDLIEQIYKAKTLQTIFFTGKKAFDIFRRLYMQSVKKQGFKVSQLFPKNIISGEKFLLKDNFFLYRDIWCILLPSPSSGAVRGKSRAFIMSGESHYPSWRLNFYREAFAVIFADEEKLF